MKLEVFYITFFLCGLSQQTVDFGNIKELFEGDICKTADGVTWTCSKPLNCPSALADIKQNRKPEICRYDDNVPIVCCPGINSTTQPKPDESVKKVKSEEACEQYQDLRCSKFKIKGRQSILGGVNSAPKEFPHMALIGYGEESSISWSCGGSLISDQYILSAAHCSNPSSLVGPARWVRLGDLNIATNLDDAKPQQFAIISRINHPDYKPPFLYNDIALYKLNQSVTYDQYVFPVCLQSLNTQPLTIGTAIGWGRIEQSGPKSNSLMKVNISIVQQEECNELIQQKNQLPRGIDGESMICAGEAEGGKDTCQGDSGGPLMLQKSSDGCVVGQQIGITSFGKICGLERSPGVYTRVSKFIPWIETIVWP